MIKLFLTRFEQNDFQTQGVMFGVENGRILFRCVTLELPWRSNQSFISCIPSGTYKAVHRESDNHKKHLLLLGVTGRDWILIHPGNYKKDTEGCILLGNEFMDINNDGHYDVTRSRYTVDRLLGLLAGEETEIVITGPGQRLMEPAA